MIVPIILFVLGLVLLIKGGDWFVDGASRIAKRLHVPELLIGATVVSIGTTLPEVMVSATSAAQGFGAMAYGNAIGSIICNTSLIAALTLAIKPCDTDRKSLTLPVAFFFFAALIYALVAYCGGYFSRSIGLCLLAVFVLYIAMNVASALKESKKNTVSEEADGSITKDLILLVVGAVFIALGAKLLVDNGTKIAQALGVPESVIALTFVALGTSLPELVTAITSLAKGHGALSLGNIIGANLFNLVLVSGLSIAIRPFNISEGVADGTMKSIAGMNASLIVDLPVMLAVMLILTVPPLVRGKLSRFQGIFLLVIYAAFCIFQFAV